MVYRVPIYTRTIKTQNWAPYCTYMHIDKVGAYVHYKDKSELTVNNLRRYLAARQSHIIHIKADNPVHFLEKFQEDYPESRVGGPGREEKVIWIEDNKPIIELPDCPYLFETEEGFRCGDPEDHPTHCCLDDNFIEPPYEDLCVPYIEYQRLYNLFNGKFESLNRYEILTNKRAREFYREDIIQGHIFLRREINAIHLSLWPYERKKEVKSFSYVS